MFSVLNCLTTQHDYRLVLLAMVTCAVTAFTCFHVYSYALQSRGFSRLAWIFLTGVSGAAGIWATHFVAMLAYDPGSPTDFDPVLTIASLLIAAAATTVGFALSSSGGRVLIAAGGAAIGLGIGMMHFTGMEALIVPGSVRWDRGLVTVSLLIGVTFSSAAVLVRHELSGRIAAWGAPLLLTLAICGLHFTAMGAASVAPDPAAALHQWAINSSTLSIAVAATAMLVMLVALAIMLISNHARQDAEAVLRSRNEALQHREEELRTQNLRFDMALKNMPHGLSMADASGRLVVCNRRYADIYSLPPEIVRPGMRVSDIFEHRVVSGIYPAEDIEAYRRERQGPVEGASVQTNELSDGRVILVSRQPTEEGGWIAIHEDITERTRLQEAERDAKDVLSAVFDAAPVAIICLAPDRQVMVWSLGASRIFGYTAEETVGQPYKLVPPDMEEEFDALFGRALAGEVFRDQYVQRRRKDGSVVEVIFASAPMYNRDGTVRGIAYVLTDISERQRLNARLEQQNRLLKQRKELVKAQNANLDMALASMSHGLAMFDVEERLVLANHRYAEIYDLKPEQVKPGMTLRQLIELRMAAGFYAGRSVEDVLGSTRELIARKAVTDLISKPRHGVVLSVSMHSRAEGGWVVTVRDITKREKLNARLEQQHKLLKSQEEQLRAQNVQLDAALNNMVQGLAMFDAEHRLLISNKRYAEMYGLPADHLMPGTPLRQILEHRVANGHVTGKSVDDMLESMLSRVVGKKSGSYANQLGDGRHISVSVQPMPDGGTVTTHQDITEQRRSEAKIVHMALHDTLTGLPNRVLLNEQLEHALTRVKRGGGVALHLIDLDHFKNVNDTLGHPAGDKLLQMVSDRLRGLAGETDTIARMGGDEFAVVQITIAQAADATSLAHRLIEVVSEPYDIDGQLVVIGTSVGIAVGRTDGTSPDQLIRNADLALYRAKGDGRGACRFFEPAMDAEMQVRRATENDLRKALATGQFELYYQPVVNVQSYRICGFEALIRWHHPQKGIVPPGMFIPLAEEIGFIVPLGEWAIKDACATAAKWPSHLKMAVNLSPAQFRSPGLVQMVVDALAASRLPAERLELEITETILMQDSDATLAMLYQLRALGVRIAMDDFGTGYSSLSYLQSFPFDKIKIDRSFVKDIAEGVGSLNIVRAVAALAHGLGMATTAEGVETEEQFQAVKAEGCTEMQGFLFSGPLPALEIEKRFLSGHECAADCRESVA